MKKVILSLVLVMLFSQIIMAATYTPACNIDTVLLNQDPYPAVPGESAKIVFQITGIEQDDCRHVKIEFLEKFPFLLDPESDAVVEVESGTYIKDFSSFLLVPYKIRIDKDALDGDNQLELKITANNVALTEKFQINVQDSRTDFEISVKDYDSKTGILIFQILNTGENDVEALTVDVPSQDNLEIKGSARNIVGSLDSNDDTTFSFEGIPKDGDIKLIVVYTDEINERRTLEKIVSFDSDLFKGRAGAEEGMSIWFYITIILVAILVYRWYRRRKLKKRHAGH
jgi:hypothetical protein